MSFKIDGRAPAIPGARPEPTTARGQPTRETPRRSLAGAPALQLRTSAAGPMAPKNAIAAKLHHAHAARAQAGPPLPEPALANPALRQRRRTTIAAGASQHPDEADELHDPDEPRAADEPEAGEAATRPRQAPRLFGPAAAEPPPATVRASGAQAVTLSSGSVAAVGANRRKPAAGPRIPYDGNSFMNSLVHAAAAMLRKNIALPSGAPLSAPMLRRHMAVHMIDVFIARNAGPDDAGKPYGAAADAPRHDVDAPQMRQQLVAALGERHADRCEGLSAAQKSQVLDMAAERPAAHGARRTRALAAILPQVATEAFPGLRLEVATRGRAPVVHGSGDGPVHALSFDAFSGRYEPVA